MYESINIYNYHRWWTCFRRLSTPDDALSLSTASKSPLTCSVVAYTITKESRETVGWDNNAVETWCQTSSNPRSPLRGWGRRISGSQTGKAFGLFQLFGPVLQHNTPGAKPTGRGGHPHPWAASTHMQRVDISFSNYAGYKTGITGLKWGTEEVQQNICLKWGTIAMRQMLSKQPLHGYFTLFHYFTWPHAH